MSFFLVKPCKSTAAYEAVPSGNLRLDLSALPSKLKPLGYELIADAKVMLVMMKHDNEISIYPSGKLLIKVHSQEVAEEIAHELELIFE
jgi:ArsR family metal-binding transcriptional regulator